MFWVWMLHLWHKLNEILFLVGLTRVPLPKLADLDRWLCNLWPPEPVLLHGWGHHHLLSPAEDGVCLPPPPPSITAYPLPESVRCHQAGVISSDYWGDGAGHPCQAIHAAASWNDCAWDGKPPIQLFINFLA
jgi:hypothetical protein